MKNILVIKLSALGDFIQALGPMQAIRKAYPDAKITILTTKPFVSFAEKSGYFNDVIVDERPRFYQLGKWFDLKSKLSAATYDDVFDLQNNSRVRKYYRPLLQKGFVWHSILNELERKEHASIRHKKILERAGISDVPLDQMEWAGQDTDLKALGVAAPYVLIVPGCDPTRPEKRWPAERYASIAQYFADKAIQPVIIGTKDEAKEAEIIKSACADALSLIGKTSLFDIPALGREAAMAVGNDTGPMHMIGPTGCKTLVLFSYASDPVKHAPVGADIKTLRKPELKSLTVDEVVQTIADW